MKLNKKMSSGLKNNFLILLLLFLNTAVRVIYSYTKPLWFDEKYSLYFASQFSYKRLFFNFSNDIHPGLFYALLKFLLHFSNSTFTLRIVLAVLPQILGILFILFSSTAKRSKNWSIVFLILCLNPFFIQLSWQIRMYNLLFFFTACLYMALCRLNKTKSLFILIISSIILFLGNYTHYSFFLISVPTLVISIFSITKKNISRSIYIALFLFASVTQFIFSAGTHPKSQFEEASWIAKPSIVSANELFQTLLGVDLKYQTNQLVIPPILFLSFILLLLVYILITLNRENDNFLRKISINRLSFHQLLFIVGISQYLLILSLSVILPFFAHRRFFFTFTPNLSLFLARNHLAGTLMLTLVVTSLIERYKKLLTMKFLLIFLFCFWVLSYTQYFVQFKREINRDEQYITSLQHFFLNKEILMWPYWDWLDLIEPTQLELIPSIMAKYEQSKSLSDVFYDSHLDQNGKNILLCEKTSQKMVLVQEGSVESLVESKNIFKNEISNCCKKIGSTDSYTEFSCD